MIEISCENCTKYNGDCGYHFIDKNGHIDWDCPGEIYCDRTGHCSYFKPNEVKHSFKFKTSANWKPLSPLCWTECPFSFNIHLGDNCRCLDKKNAHECPFTSCDCMEY